MTRTRTAAAAALLCLLASPVLAGGQVGVTLDPGSPEGDVALRTGLLVYGLANGMTGNGHIQQNGNGNAGGLLQGGAGNLGIVHQDGDGHQGTLQQDGGGNAHGLFQFGRGADGHVSQSGGESGLTLQYGF